MLTPTVIEIRRALEPVSRDTFIGEATKVSDNVVAFPTRASRGRQQLAVPRAA